MPPAHKPANDCGNNSAANSYACGGKKSVRTFAWQHDARGQSHDKSNCHQHKHAQHYWLSNMICIDLLSAGLLPSLQEEVYVYLVDQRNTRIDKAREG